MANAIGSLECLALERLITVAFLVFLAGTAPAEVVATEALGLRGNRDTADIGNTLNLILN